MIQLNQVAGEVYCKIGTRLFRQGDHAEAQKWLRKALAVKPKHPDFHFEALYHLGEIARANGNSRWKYYFNKGLKMLLKKRRKSHLDLYRIGSTLKKTGRPKESKPWFQRIVNGYPPLDLHAGAWFHLGELYHMENNMNQSALMFQRCLTLMPHHQKAKQYLQDIRSKGGPS
ncbi:MAG: tetratricopeptide repeat protein [bacterium]|nr:tetratricopeptide repeat protein [bacterium]